MNKFKKATLLAVILTAGLCLTGCGVTPVIDTPEYTEQTARAIEGFGWKLYWGLVGAAIIRGILNK